MGKHQKYVAVNSNSPDELEIDPKRSIISTQCIWTSIRIALLLAVYFVPSISLTFYQRWLLQVNKIQSLIN